MFTTTDINGEALRAALRISGATALAFVALISVWAFVGQAAAEESRCASREELRSTLEQRFAEAPVAAGKADHNAVVELFADIDGATWTIVVTGPNGQSCILTTGTDWRPSGADQTGQALLPVLDDRSWR